MEKDNADDQTYQIAGRIYRAMGQEKDAEKLYKKAIKGYPKRGHCTMTMVKCSGEAGPRCNKTMGERNTEDPSYGGNYYNACKYYSLTTDKIWSLFTGNIY